MAASPHNVTWSIPLASATNKLHTAFFSICPDFRPFTSALCVASSAKSKTHFTVTSWRASNSCTCATDSTSAASGRAAALLRRRLGVPPGVCGTSVMARLLSEHCQTTLAPMLVPQTAESLRHYTLSFTGPSPAVSSGPSPACSDFSRSTLFLPFPPSLLQHHFALSKLFLWWLRHCAPPFSGRGRRTLEVTTPTALLGVLPPAATLLLPHPSSKSHRLLLPPTVSPWAKPCPSLSQALGTPDLIFCLPFSKPSRP